LEEGVNGRLGGMSREREGAIGEVKVKSKSRSKGKRFYHRGAEATEVARRSQERGAAGSGG
jgi:hypothetical protein